jgi:hypothetical protein
MTRMAGYISITVHHAARARPMSKDKELAEMIAKFRTPPGFQWADLAADIETAIKGVRREERKRCAELVRVKVDAAIKAKSHSTE